MIRHGGGDGAACEDALCRSSLLDGEYLNSKTEARWQAWQARAALPGPVVVGGRTTEILGPYRHGWLEGREDALRCIAAYDHDSADADARIWDGDAPGPVEIALDTLHDEVSGIKIPMGEDPALPLPSVEDVARVIADAALYGHGRGNIEEARTSARAVLALFPPAPQEGREDDNAKAVSILRVGCEQIDGLPIAQQSCPEDMAMWATTYIERLKASPALPAPSVEEVAKVLCHADNGRDFDRITGTLQRVRLTQARAVLALFPAAPQAEREFFEAAKESERLLRKHPHGMDRHEADLTRAATYDAMQEAADATP